MRFNIHLFIYLFVIFGELTGCFINMFPIKTDSIVSLNIANWNERKIYGSYLLGLRKSRKLLQNNYNKDDVDVIVNFTKTFLSNYSYVNNTEVKVQNIVMKNIVLDVSNIKQIHIKTKKDTLIIELDKNNKRNSIISNANSLENLISAISLFGKIININ